MLEKIVRLTGTTRTDEFGCPRQDNIAYLKVGESLKGSAQSELDDDYNETQWVVVTDENGGEIGEIRDLDADLIIGNAKHGRIIHFTVSKLNKTNSGNISVYVLVQTYTKKEAQKLAASGAID